MALRRDLKTFDEFWPIYLREHTSVRCRALHYLAAVMVLVVFVTSTCTQCWWLLLTTPVCAYTLAWFGHLIFEGNRPATWVYPWWSLRAEARMVWLALTGRLSAHLQSRPPQK